MRLFFIGNKAIKDEKQLTEYTGIIILNKPKRITSHDCIIRLRKLLKMKRIGHTGTLDPDVTGVLPICLGKATKIAEYITDAGKEYIGEVTLGFSTTTEDQSGDIVDKKVIDCTITRAEILAVFEQFTGEITQTPPMFSAVKVNGKRLYEYALDGQVINRPSRKVTISELELLDEQSSFSGETISFSFRVACSKGTYIRTLAVMIGEKLGYPAHMSRLVRSRSAQYTLENALTLEEVASLIETEQLMQHIQPIESGVSGMPFQIANEVLAKRIANGALLAVEHDLPTLSEPTAIFNQVGQLLAIYQNHPSKEGILKPVKII